VDFAYTVHTEVGHTCIGAKVNGRIVALRYSCVPATSSKFLPSGTSSQPRLAAICQVPARAAEDQAWLNVHQRERAIEIGRKLIEKEARKYRIAMKTISDTELMRVSSENGLAKLTICWPPSAMASFSARSILARLVPPDEAHTCPARIRLRKMADRTDSPAWCDAFSAATPQPSRSKTMTICWSIGRDVVTDSREEIEGYVTRGKGVAVHSRSCSNVVNLMFEPERRIAVEWGRDAATPNWQAGYPVKLPCIAITSRHVEQIATVISDANTNIRNIEAKTAEDQATSKSLPTSPTSSTWNRIVTGVRKIPGVRDVRRLQKL